jgi:hypothetical protein
MSRDGDIVWSTDGESYNHDTMYEALEAQFSYINGEYIPAQVGDTLYYGTAVALDVTKLVDSGDIIEMLGERAWDFAGEWAEDFPDVSKEERNELDDFLKSWFEKYCKPTFYSVKDIKEYTITEEDIRELNDENILQE